MKKLIGKLLCKLGNHKWVSEYPNGKNYCERCKITYQEAEK